LDRSKKIVVLSHCLLNQNTVIAEEARAMGAIPSVVSWALEKGYGMVQLPCPEFTYLGINRPPMTYEEYDTAEYRQHCREILLPVVRQLQEYGENGYEIVGTVGIGRSPSCDPGRGVFMEEFQALLKERHIHLEDWWYLPPVEDPVFQQDKHKI
jgi:predicted secreted protein